jgi:hypothetical protein
MTISCILFTDTTAIIETLEDDDEAILSMVTRHAERMSMPNGEVKLKTRANGDRGEWQELRATLRMRLRGVTLMETVVWGPCPATSEGEIRLQQGDGIVSRGTFQLHERGLQAQLLTELQGYFAEAQLYRDPSAIPDRVTLIHGGLQATFRIAIKCRYEAIFSRPRHMLQRRPTVRPFRGDSDTDEPGEGIFTLVSTDGPRSVNPGYRDIYYAPDFEQAALHLLCENHEWPQTEMFKVSGQRCHIRSDADPEQQVTLFYRVLPVNWSYSQEMSWFESGEEGRWGWVSELDRADASCEITDIVVLANHSALPLLTVRLQTDRHPVHLVGGLMRMMIELDVLREFDPTTPFALTICGINRGADRWSERIQLHFPHEWTWTPPVGLTQDDADE